MNYNFVEEQKRFYHLSKSLYLKKIKDPEVKKYLELLTSMVHISKELTYNDRRLSNRKDS